MKRLFKVLVFNPRQPVQHLYSVGGARVRAAVARARAAAPAVERGRGGRLRRRHRRRARAPRRARGGAPRPRGKGLGFISGACSFKRWLTRHVVGRAFRTLGL